eukprot:g12895.t1
MRSGGQKDELWVNNSGESTTAGETDEDSAGTSGPQTQEDIAKAFQGREFLLIGETHDAQIAKAVRVMLRNQAGAGAGIAKFKKPVGPSNQVDFELFEELDPVDKRAVLGPNSSGMDAVLDFLENGDHFLESDSLHLMVYGQLFDLVKISEERARHRSAKMRQDKRTGISGSKPLGTACGEGEGIYGSNLLALLRSAANNQS